MPTFNGRTAPFSGESPLDTRLCGEIGAELARVRLSRGLSVAQAAEKLLLSTRQVAALEQVEVGAFHNATFYLKALRKYVTFLDLDPARVEVIASAIAQAPEPLLVSGGGVRGSVVGDAPGRLLIVTVAVLVLAVAAGVGVYLLRAHGTAGVAPVVAPFPLAVPMPPALSPVGTQPLQPAVMPAMDTPASRLTDDAVPLGPTGFTAFGSVRVMRAAWVFVRDAENVEIERSLAEGERFELATQPTYLAVGTVDAELTIGGRSTDVSRFVANGQLRIRAGDFDALVQGAFPSTAPTPAAVVR